MMRKKYFQLVVGFAFFIFFISITCALTGSNSNIETSENIIGDIGISENSIILNNYSIRSTGGFLLVGSYISDISFGRFGILGVSSSVCGNGLLEGEEACDNGTLNGNICLASCDTTCYYCDSGCTTQSVTGGTCGTGDCFIAGTQILMASGNSKNIEDIKIGDLIKTVNMENMKIENKLVLELTSPIHNNLVILEFEDAINTNTFDHPYFIKGKNWTSYKPKLTLERYKITTSQLEVGDIAYFFDGKLKKSKLLSINEINSETQTYNLHNVFENNNFFANGVLVHNKGSTECADECTTGSISSVCKNDITVETKTCGNFDTDDCSEWGNLVLETCIGRCADGECIGEYINESTNESIDENTNENTGEKKYNKCTPNWECGEWGECTGKTDANSIFLDGGILGDSHKERMCVDKNHCVKDKIETISCTDYDPVDTRTVEWCDEEYVEILDSNTNKVIGKVKEEEFLGITTLKRVDINFQITEFSGYCDYCFNKIKDHDEAGIDCGGPRCPECVVQKEYVDWVLYVVILSWIMMSLLLSILAIEEKDKIKEVFFVIVESAKLRSQNEAIMEKRIISFIKRFFRIPFVASDVGFSKIKLSNKNIQKTGQYSVKKIPVISKTKLHKSWLKNSLLKIKKNKRKGFLGNEGSINEVREKLNKK